MKPSKKFLQHDKLSRVTLVGRNVWSLIGICHLLGRYEDVIFGVMHDLPKAVDELDKSDVVVWLREKNDGFPELASLVVRLRRLRPDIKQLVVSDFIPAGLTEIHCPLSGVWVAHGRARTEMLIDLLDIVIAAPSRAGSLLSKTLSPGQWKVLQLRVAGFNANEIAQICRIGYKTVSVQESAIRYRLGLANRAEYAWLLRCVAALMDVAPGLTPHARRVSEVRT